MPEIAIIATLDEALELTPGQILKAILLVLLAEINRSRAFDAAIVADLLQRVNELRALHGLAALTAADLTAKAPPPLTVDQALAAIKANL